MKVGKVGSTRQNTNFIFLFMVFTFAIMFLMPLMFVLRLSYTGVAALFGVVIMAMIGSGLIFFVTKNQQAARGITVTSVILVEIAIVIVFIFIIVALVNSNTE